MTRLEEVVFRKQDGNEEKVEENMHLQYGDDQGSLINERDIDSSTRLEGSKVEKNEVETFVAKLEATKEVLNGSQESYMKDSGVPMKVDTLKGSNCSSFTSCEGKVAFVNRKKPSSCLRIARPDLHKLR
uniref:Uncharacterized protein n=1 Tax=Chenopodium quinoa TaxID=63459 RepID=A0A803M852_CHEQI